MNSYVEQVRTKWKRFGCLRLRVCLECREVFPSSSAAERMCNKCVKRAEDARARSFISSQEAELRELLLDWFDFDLLDRLRRERDHDASRRAERRRGVVGS